MPTPEEIFAALRADRATEDEEIVTIGNAPSFESLKRWMDARGERASEPDVPPPVYYFSGAPVVVDGKHEPNPLGEIEGHRLVGLINASRNEISGPHETHYEVRCPEYDLGHFDSGAEQLHIEQGIWWPDIEQALVRSLGGGFTRYWNRWEHHFTLAGHGAIATYWFNEILYGGEVEMLLAPDHRDAALVVNAADEVLAATRQPLADFAASSSAAATEYEAPDLTWNHDESVHEVVVAVKELLPGEPRAYGPKLYNFPDIATRESEISAAEARWGLQLPLLMRELLLTSRGNGVGLGGDVSGINQKASEVRPLGGLGHIPWWYDRQMTPDIWKPMRPLSLLVPFTGDGHADVCLDYRRRGPNVEPQISLIDTELPADRIIADSFPEYVSMMQSVEFGIPAAPGVTADQILDDIRTSYGEIEVEEFSSRGLRLKVEGELLCWISNYSMPGYEDCEITVQVEHSDTLQRLVRSLVQADLLEGSVPLQRWNPHLWA